MLDFRFLCIWVPKKNYFFAVPRRGSFGHILTMQLGPSKKGAGDGVPHRKRSVTYNEGANDNDAGMNGTRRNQVLANQWQRHQYEGFCWRQQREGKQPMPHAAWSQLKTQFGAELELKRLWVAEQDKQRAQV